MNESKPGNPAVFRRFLEALNGKDLDALDDLMTADFERHCGATEPLEIKSREAFKAFQQDGYETFPDLRLEAKLVISDGDHLAASMILSGTQNGPLGPFPPTGNRVSVPFLTILRLSGGRIAEMWVEWDNMYMLRKLGHLPPPDSNS